MKLLKSLYFWTLTAFIFGSLFGALFPSLAVHLEPLGINFIKLVKLFIAPIIFCTVVTGIAQTKGLGKLGSISLKAFIYFEIISSLALLTGWLVGHVLQPGKAMPTAVSSLDAQPVAKFITDADHLSFIGFLQGIIPNSLIEPFSSGNLLQILFIAILLGVALVLIGQERNARIIHLLTDITTCLFQCIRLIMYAAPLGVFGAMAFTVSKFGSASLLPLLGLIAAFYLTCCVFVMFLGIMAKMAGFSIRSFIRYLLPELLLILGTSSSESALPQLIRKLEKLGCSKETVGVVIPMGYSFNLDGTNIYISLAALFIAQALGIELTFGQQIAIFLTAMLTSKGAAGVSGAGFITLAATLSVTGVIPAAGIVLILGIDRFMSEARSLVNFLGNGVGTLIISRWQKELTAAELTNALQETRNTPKITAPISYTKIFKKGEIA